MRKVNIYARSRINARETFVSSRIYTLTCHAIYNRLVTVNSKPNIVIVKTNKSITYLIILKHVQISQILYDKTLM